MRRYIVQENHIGVAVSENMLKSKLLLTKNTRQKENLKKINLTVTY